MSFNPTVTSTATSSDANQGGATALAATKSQLGTDATTHTDPSNDAQTADVSATVEKKTGHSSLKTVILGATVIMDAPERRSEAKAIASEKYINKNGAPALPHQTTTTDTFNVYVIDESVEATSANEQMATISAETNADTILTAINVQSQQQQIQDTLNAIAQQAHAAAEQKKSQSIDAITEGLSIGLGALMVVASIACYATGVGAAAGVGLDAAADATITGAVTADATASAAAATADAATDASLDASIDTAINSGEEGIELSNMSVAQTTSEATTQAATQATTEATTQATEATTVETVTNAADAAAKAAASKALTSLASWSLMGASTIVMSIPQAGGKAMSDMALSIAQDSGNKISVQEAEYIAMAISTVAMLVGGALMYPTTLASMLTKAGTMAAEGVSEATTSLASALARTSNMSFPELVQAAKDTAIETGVVLSESTTVAYEASEKATMAFLKGLMDTGTYGINSFASASSQTASAVSDTYKATLEALTELLTSSNPMTLVAKRTSTAVTVILRVLCKMFDKILINPLDKIATPFASTTLIGKLGEAGERLLPLLMVVSQASDMALDLYGSVLNLQMAQTEYNFLKDQSESILAQAETTSTENIINFCTAQVQAQLGIMNSLVTQTGNTLAEMAQPISS